MLFAAETAHPLLADETKVLEEIVATPDKGIPQELSAKAHCIIIVPGTKQAALGIGGTFGRGYALCRQNRVTSGGPAGIRIEGASAGPQIAASNTDIVMLVTNDRGTRRLLEDQFTLGSEATVAAGPVGGQTSASTDVRMSAKILAWSRSKGLIAGVALEGATLRPDNAVNQKLYGGKLANHEILTDGRPTPDGKMGSLTAA